MERYIAYYRVSTKKQGKSGLGIEAQKTAVHNFVQSRNSEVIKDFTEVESGKNPDRPVLKSAIALCKKENAKLLVAKLDRLSRNAKFLFTLKEELESAGIGFTIADMPEANTLVLGFMASLAQYEAELISKRTKEGLAEARKRGKKLGNPKNLSDTDRLKGSKRNSENARNHIDTRKAFHFIQPRREKGWSYTKIAKALNEEGYLNRNGGKFYPAQISTLLNLYKSNKNN